MAKPPATPPHSDTEGVHRDARAGAPNRDPSLGSSKEVGEAEADSKGRPERSAERDAAG